MRMPCTTCGQSNFKLKGRAGASPRDGWAIRAMPANGVHLQKIWDSIRPEATGPDDALTRMKGFLDANSVTYATGEIEAIGHAQWCDLDAWMCGEGPRLADSGKPLKEKIRGARVFWEQANRLMAIATDDNAHAVLTQIIADATQLANGPGGCKKCASKWEILKTNYPLGTTASLRSAREHLVFLHNGTREGKKPVPYIFVAHKFGWL